MASLYTQQGKNVSRTWLLMGAFLIIVILIGWGASYYFNSSGVLYIAVAFALFMNVSAYWFSDKIALVSTGAKLADEHEYLELHRVVENLAITAGLPKPRVYIIQDAAPNAFASGRNKEHAVIAVTTGLLGILSKTELEGVLAHELSHIGNRDIFLMTVAVVLVGFLSILADISLRMSLFGGGDRDRDNKNPIALIAIIVGMILAPIAAQLIQLAISRKREFLADASGALLTRYPEGLASALQKIGSYPAPMRRASTATAHLFISNPFGAAASRRGAGAFVRNLFSTHPPVGERIAALQGMNVS